MSPTVEDLTSDTRAFWRGKNVFVTGATGFLGGWLVQELNRQGAAVVGLARSIRKEQLSADETTIRPARLVEGRLEDLATLQRVIGEHAVDTVFHLGGQPIVGIAVREPLATFEANIRGTWNLLEACRQAKSVKRIVVASSDKAYGTADSMPLDESLPLRGAHPYDVSKSCTDLISQTYFETYGLPVCVTRCGNIFGGRDLNWNRIVPSVIRAALAGERPTIRSDGTMIRDYMYVRDVVGAYLALAQRMDRPEVRGEAFNLGSDQPLSVIAMAEAILTSMRLRDSLSPIILNQASAELPAQYVTAAKARRVLGWAPRWSLHDALTETVSWYRTHLEAQRFAARAV